MGGANGIPTTAPFMYPMYIATSKLMLPAKQVKQTTPVMAQDCPYPAPIKGRPCRNCTGFLPYSLSTIIEQPNIHISSDNPRFTGYQPYALPRSLRAGSRGPYRWLKKTAVITHSPLLDMPPHQLPARSQILHRVSILVEAKPQN